MQDIVSIITPLYNAERYIGQTIESVLGQSYQHWELLIVDDCSTDHSPAIVEAYAGKDDRIRLIKLEKNAGAAISRNTAIEHARGRYIAFLDSDDLWTPTKLEEQLHFMQVREIAFSFTGYIKIDEDGSEKGRVHIPERVNYQKLLKSNVIGCLTAIYDTPKIGKVMMPDIRKRQDHALWLRILKDHTEYAYGLDKPLARYRVREDSISSNKLNAASYQWKLYREIEKLNILKSIYYFTNYAYLGYRKSKI